MTYFYFSVTFQSRKRSYWKINHSEKNAIRNSITPDNFYTKPPMFNDQQKSLVISLN